MADIKPEVQCCLCQSTFPPDKIDENSGKCPDCKERFPTVSNRKELLTLHEPNLELNKQLTEEDVRKIVRDELNKIELEKPDLEEPDWVEWVTEQFENSMQKKKDAQERAKKAREAKENKETK